LTKLFDGHGVVLRPIRQTRIFRRNIGSDFGITDLIKYKLLAVELPPASAVKPSIIVVRYDNPVRVIRLERECRA
jgi:hypothetical protein